MPKPGWAKQPSAYILNFKQHMSYLWIYLHELQKKIKIHLKKKKKNGKTNLAHNLCRCFWPFFFFFLTNLV